jgi:hypothetical protein
MRVCRGARSSALPPLSIASAAAEAIVIGMWANAQSARFLELCRGSETARKM